MKTVNDIIWSELFDEDTSIMVFAKNGKQLTTSNYITHRYYEDISVWGQYDAYLISYRPIQNILLIYIDYIAKEEQHDPT